MSDLFREPPPEWAKPGSVFHALWSDTRMVRQTQKLYFKTRDRGTLQTAQRRERELDAMLKRLGEQFGYQEPPAA